MGTSLLAGLALACSLAPLLWLALRDPKRLRSLRRPVPAAPRPLLVFLALLPGLALMLRGHWPAFLVWSGALTACGWLLVQWLAREQPALSGNA